MPVLQETLQLSIILRDFLLHTLYQHTHAIYRVFLDLFHFNFTLNFFLQSSVFPPENQISPVADQLRQMLTNAPWARVGLGLPVVSA